MLVAVVAGWQGAQNPWFEDSLCKLNQDKNLYTYMHTSTNGIQQYT